jgi:hypothetical protein
VSNVTNLVRTIPADVSPSLYMPNSNPADSLAKLQADLKHFEESGDLGEKSSVAVVKEHLRRRIAELEAVVRRTEDSHSANLA